MTPSLQPPCPPLPHPVMTFPCPSPWAGTPGYQQRCHSGSTTIPPGSERCLPWLQGEQPRWRDRDAVARKGILREGRCAGTESGLRSHIDQGGGWGGRHPRQTSRSRRGRNVRACCGPRRWGNDLPNKPGGSFLPQEKHLLSLSPPAFWSGSRLCGPEEQLGQGSR